MSENECDLVRQMHREAVEQHRERKEIERALVESLFREALQRHREQELREQALVEAIHREACLEIRQHSSLAAEQAKGVSYTQLPEAIPGEPLVDEWNTYRAAIGHLLAEGHTGKHVLIKGTEIIGIFDTSDAAYEAGLQRYLREPFFVHPIRPEEPYLRIRGINHPWPSSLSR